jgi:ABC-type antimicrobial peptide transport system permease subunit
VFAEGLRLTAAGIAAGLLASIPLLRLVASAVEGIPAGDLRIPAAAGGVLLAAGVAASLGPAARAMRIDPARSLRGD